MRFPCVSPSVHLSFLTFFSDHNHFPYNRRWSQHLGNIWLIKPKISAAALATTSYPTGGCAEPLAKGGPRAKRGLG